MSAWFLPRIQLSIIRDGIVNHEFMTKDEADKLVFKFSRMNAYAIKCRYGENKRPLRPDPEITYAPTIPALRKMLNCLRYQCSEGDTDTKHKKVWHQLDFLIGQCADAILNAQPDCGRDQHLPWGIFNESERKEYETYIPLKKATEATA
jgi:hypothetical protein